MEEDNNISARPITQRFIELNGVIGEFFLENKKVKVRYFSTVASGNDKKSHNLDLLRELKPMRDRVKASQLKDLDSLLQRNLNDNRVSSELIPYLINTIPQIAFFTPILSVLIPKDSLNNTEESDYPLPSTEKSKSNGNRILNYNNLWKLEFFKASGQELNLGILSFDPNTVDLVVLDGQHRANAFRVVAGAFNDTDSAVFPVFYNQIPKPKDFSADLPVTIIWFEVESPRFDPKIVSRRLFVDVNNTAKRVSRSRTILLDESESTACIVRFFYSQLASNRSFERNRFSLFQSGFDIDSDITISSTNPFALTNPQVFYDIIAWLTLGAKRYNGLNIYQVSREAFKNSTISFNGVFRNENFNSNDIIDSEESLDTRKIIIANPEKVEVFEKEYLLNLHNTLLSFYDNFNLFKIHYKACEKIDSWFSSGMDSTEMSTWKEIFCGGEGLYYTFMDTSIDVTKKESLGRFIKAIDSIESRLKKERSTLLLGIDPSSIDSAFESASSKAFQIGMFMALDIYRSDSSFEESFDPFFNKINTIAEKNWIYILTVFRKRLMPNGATPKLWPTYQKLILRLIQDNDNPYYSDGNFLDSPDGRLFREVIASSFSSWLEGDDSIEIESLTIESITPQIEGWKNKAKNDIEELFKPLEINIIKADYLTITKEIIDNELRILKG